MAAVLPEIQDGEQPDRAIVLVEEDVDTDLLAMRAVNLARAIMPKVTGHSALTLQPIYGENFFGIYFPERQVWFLERGTRPFTMHALAGKTIPMWIDDPSGQERRANPKAKTRVTADGRTQVLIFRRAARKGQRKMVTRTGANGAQVSVSVPMSYPGAAGRIGRREATRPFTRAGKRGGQVAVGNVGVRWRNPGIVGRHTINAAVTETAFDAGLDPQVIYMVDAIGLYSVVR